MAKAHRNNVLVTSCLKTPVDPHTRTPLASYERGRVLPYTTAHLDNRDYEQELEYEDTGSDFYEEDFLEDGSPLIGSNCKLSGDHFRLREIFFSNKEYYSKLEELKRAHLRTMAELESLYKQKLQLKSSEVTVLDLGDRLLWANCNQTHSCPGLRKSHSAVELRWTSDPLDEGEDEAAANDVEKGLLLSPKEHIKNMWKDFKVTPYSHHMSSSLRSLQVDQTNPQRRKAKQSHAELEQWKTRVTVPKPFNMMLREAEKQKHGVKTRAEAEQESKELQKQIEQLAECQRQFRASPVPAHVHLPLYEELQERREERRRAMRDPEELHRRTVQKPFSFLERERLKKEQRQLSQARRPSDPGKARPFKAKPVPKCVYAAASAEQAKEEQLYRSIKMQMRAQEMLHSASLPPSMLTRRLAEHKKTKDEGDEGFSHSPRINREVPDFEASYRRFQKHLEKRKETKPTTACEPFELRTAQIPSHRERILAEIQSEHSSPRAPRRWPGLANGPASTPNSSLCSSLSGSLEVLPAKVTDATKKRHDAVRKVLEQRKKAEEEEQQRREKQRQKEKKLKRVVLKRAQANDPHVALSQTNVNKLKEFRKQDIQRRKEYQQEIKEMKERVKGRPLLLEQVAQRNAKQAAEKRYADTLHRLDMTEEFISSKAEKPDARISASPPNENKDGDPGEADADYELVLYKKVFLDGEDGHDQAESEGKGENSETSSHFQEGEDSDGHYREQDYHYSDDSYNSSDHDNYSDDSNNSDREADSGQQEAGD
ncbi:protein FAM161A [Menidia menidia]